jgi:trehalose-phosphatase
MAALQARVRSNDVQGWVARFLDSAADAAAHRPATVSSAEHVARRLGPWLARRATLALFLDYDGTLTPIASRPELATLDDESRRVLEQAATAPDLDVTIVSGRPVAEVRAMIGVDGLTYVGDHGYDIDGPGLSYRHDASRFEGALARAAEDLEELGVPDAWVERKRAAVAYHVRGVPGRQQADALRRATSVLKRRRLAALRGKAVLEGRPPVSWDKGSAVLYVLRSRYGSDWPARVRALYVGDDSTDELAFRVLGGIGRSILVGPRDPTQASAADLALDAPSDVIALVRRLASEGIRTLATAR